MRGILGEGVHGGLCVFQRSAFAFWGEREKRDLV